MNKKIMSQVISDLLTKRFVILLAPIALMPSFSAMAAEEAAIDEVIVTGTANGEAIRKLDASFAISTVSDKDIAEVAPSSTADLLKTVPGVWVESSGGVSGANVFVRGFPSGGDADFLTLSINGLPVYPAPSLSFMENTTLFRIDETIDHLEGLRGGPNPVFANGQVGLTTNFLLKEGGEETEGVVKYSMSDYDLQRVDVMSSGKLADNLYYMVGGYISSSPGIRDAGFNAEEGHQFTLNITKVLDNGKIEVFHRATDDHGTWYLPQALDNGVIKTGLDASYTQVGPSNRKISIPVSGVSSAGIGNSEVTWKSFNLGEGRGWDGSVTGGNIQLALANDWNFTDRFSLTKGAANTLGFVPQGGAQTLGSLNGGVDGETISGNDVMSSDLVQQFGGWVVEKDIKTFNSDFSFSKKWESFKVTAGVYTSEWGVDEQWSIGNQKWYQLKHDGEQISAASMPDVACQANAQTTCTWKYDVDASGEAREVAEYLATEFYFGEWTMDFGVRNANRKTVYNADTGARDGIFETSADANVTKQSYTGAVNWNYAEDQGIFFRMNSGFKFADFDDYRNFNASYKKGSNLVIEVDQQELGYKLSRGDYSLYATLFHNTTNGAPDCNVGGPVCTRFETHSTGIELDGNWSYGDFSINLNGTIQNPVVDTEPNAGNQVLRQPKSQFRLTPSYKLSLGNADINLYGTVSRISDRFGDNSNTNKLAGYTKLDVGTIVTLDKLSFQLAVDNLTDEQALTESDPRAVGLSSNGRYIMPRNIKLTVGYRF